MNSLRADSSASQLHRLSRIALLGIAVVVFLHWRGASPQLLWPAWMILFSAAVLIPIGNRLSPFRGADSLRPMHVLAVFLLAESHVHPVGDVAFLFALFWWGERLGMATASLIGWCKKPELSAKSLCFLAAACFPAVGASWLLAQRVGWMPFGFDSLIVMLTAAHFHHAGFSLPLIVGLQAERRPCAWTHGSCLLILAGVPLVATGITCTHFHLLTWVEPVGVTILVLGAFGVALEQVRTACASGISVWLRLAFLLSGLSLFIAMLLALGYGLRVVLPGMALSMPQMWALHGSLNAFGFGLLGLLAWSFLKNGEAHEC
jgi:hypothetical protein